MTWKTVAVNSSNTTSVSGLQAKALDIMNNDFGSHVKTLLIERITDPITQVEYSVFNFPKRNPLVRIAHINTVIFARSTYRATDNDELNADYHQYVEPPDIAFENAEYLHNAMGDCFLMPYYDEYEKIIRHDIIKATQIHKLEIIRSRIHALSLRYSVGAMAEILGKWATELDPDDDCYVKYLYDGTYYIYLDEDMEEQIHSGDTGYGELPIVWFSLGCKTQSEPWGIRCIKDIIDGTVEVGWLEMLYNRTAYRRSYRQAMLDPTSQVAVAQGKLSKIQMSPSSVLPTSLKFEQTVDESSTYLDSIERQESYLAATRGISSQSYYRKYEKDFVQHISSETRQVWKKSLKHMITPERKYMKLLIKAMNKYCGCSYDPKIYWLIDHIEPIPELDNPIIAGDVLDMAIARGSDDVICDKIRQHPELITYENAKKQIQEHIDVRNMIIERQIERNKPTTEDTPQGEKTVGENGKDGGDSKAAGDAITRSATGADGVSGGVISKDLRDI